jgi:hypothetical protein
MAGGTGCWSCPRSTRAWNARGMHAFKRFRLEAFELEGEFKQPRLLPRDVDPYHAPVRQDAAPDADHLVAVFNWPT